MPQTPEIDLEGEVMVFGYHHIPDEPGTGFHGSIEINDVYENGIRLNWQERDLFWQDYEKDKIKKMILSGSTIYE